MRKSIFLTLVGLTAMHFVNAQTKAVTVDANDVLNSNNKLVINSGVGQSFFTGHQVGTGYVFPSAGIFRAITDNPSGGANYYYDGVTNGVVNFSVKASGQGYFAGNVGIGTTSPATLLHIATTAGPVLTLDKTGVQAWRLDASQGSDFRLWNASVGAAPLTIQALGNVGIGTTSPTDLLHVNGSIAVQSFGFLSSRRGDFNNYTNMFLGGALKDNGDGTFTVRGDGGSNYFGAIRMDNNGGNVGAISFYSGTSTGGSNYNITNSNLANYLRMTIVNGNVGIGIANPQNKLDVNGTIHSKVVVVDLTGWNDYVFKKDYQLRSLSEVKAYIDQNQHLPEIPAEQEMIKNGLDVGEMNKLLMKKVEELTLYMIEKDKQIEDQQKVNQSLQRQIDKLAKLLNQ